jgi:hypothetical protein
MQRTVARLARLALVAASTVPIALCADSRAASLVQGSHRQDTSYQSRDNTAHTFRAVQMLISRGDEDPAAAIRAACGLGWTSLVELLLERYPAPSDTVVLLLEACVRKHLRGDPFKMTPEFERVVVAAFARGADRLAVGQRGDVPLGAMHMALLLKSAPLVRLLLRLGVDSERKYAVHEWGAAPMSPADAAIRFGLGECYCALMEARGERWPVPAAPTAPPATVCVAERPRLLDERMTGFVIGVLAMATASVVFPPPR